MTGSGEAAMTDLTEMVDWLRGVVNGDLAKAKAATPGPWHWDDTRRGLDMGPRLVSEVDDDPDGVIRGWGSGQELDGEGLVVSPENQAHIATHDPNDTIARCEQELEIIETCSFWLHEDDRGVDPCAKAVLEGLAYGYRNRPGWKIAWKPFS